MEKEKPRTTPMRPVLLAAMAVWATVGFRPIEDAMAKTPVSIELVFAVDTSMSIDGFEYQLIMKGIAGAFRTLNLRFSQAAATVTFPRIP